MREPEVKTMISRFSDSFLQNSFYSKTKSKLFKSYSTYEKQPCDMFSYQSGISGRPGDFTRVDLADYTRILSLYYSDVHTGLLIVIETIKDS